MRREVDRLSVESGLRIRSGRDALTLRLDDGLVYICNPNNPTGSLTRRRDLEAFIARLPAAMHVVIDEAYHHYVDDASDYRSFIDHPMRDRRVIVTRSFSKIHGLAPARIGYAVASADGQPDSRRIGPRMESTRSPRERPGCAR